MQSQSILLRSSSAPTPSSLLPCSSRDSSPEHPETVLHLPKARSFASQRQNISDADPHVHHSPSKPETRNCIPRSSILKKEHNSIKVKENDAEEQKTHTRARPGSIRELFSSSGLDKQVLDNEEDEGSGGGGKGSSKLQTLVMGGGMGSDGGRICRGHGSGWESYEENSHGRDRTDTYYQSMIEANPNDALLLGNYAKFLKEVRRDYPKAEEYLERAILANPDDATVLSLYADLIWQTQKNADRAEGYFDQAVKTAPDDCYVLASYAKFLWDAEEEEEEEDKNTQHALDHHSNEYSAGIYGGNDGHPHFNAVSQPYLSVTE